MSEVKIFNHEAWHVCPRCGNEWDLKDHSSCPTADCKYVYNTKSASKQSIYGLIGLGTIMFYFWVAWVAVQILRLLPEITNHFNS